MRHFLLKPSMSIFRTLIKRGADFNKEDYRGLRPDDLNPSLYPNDDCREIITSHRALRLKKLTEKIQNVGKSFLLLEKKNCEV